jgi:hypothetical protein
LISISRDAVLSDLDRASTARQSDILEAGEGDYPSLAAFKTAFLICGALSDRLFASDDVLLALSFHRHDSTASMGIDGQLLSSTRIPMALLVSYQDIPTSFVPSNVTVLQDCFWERQSDIKVSDNPSEFSFGKSSAASQFDVVGTVSALLATVTTGFVFLFGPRTGLKEKEPFNVTPLSAKVTDSCPINPVGLGPDFW